MNGFVNKLIDLLEPTINDLDDNLKELSEKQNSLNEINKMLDEVGDDVGKVGTYENQDLILNHLSNLNTNEKEYRACCYLLNSKDKNVCMLPQYIESSNYISRLINYFKKKYEELALDVADLKVVCDTKKINKKYLEIFKEENPVISDTVEFRNFLDNQELSSEDKINLLIYTIKSNINSYLKEERVKGR